MPSRTIITFAFFAFTSSLIAPAVVAARPGPIIKLGVDPVQISELESSSDTISASTASITTVSSQYLASISASTSSFRSTSGTTWVSFQNTLLKGSSSSSRVGSATRPLSQQITSSSSSAPNKGGTATRVFGQTAASSSKTPVAPQTSKSACSKLRQRREWRALSNADKARYIKAVKCLQATPADKPVIPQAKSRYDEFQALHIQQADFVHYVGQFLPWHRQYVKLFEDDLRNKCGYQGGVPYWDWSIDSDSSKPLTAAPVFDPHTGFGGNGVPGTYFLPSSTPPADFRIIPSEYVGCVRDGPFANHTIPLGPGKYVGDHCLTRGVQEAAKAYLNSTMVAMIASQPTFEDFRIQIEGQPITPSFRVHDGGHFGVGGEMSNFYSSPGDPLFYLHHANLDRIWWRWQQVTPFRLYEISGRTTTIPPFHNATLGYPLVMDTLGPSAVIRDVMDIQSEPNCYTYV